MICTPEAICIKDILAIACKGNNMYVWEQDKMKRQLASLAIATKMLSPGGSTQRLSAATRAFIKVVLPFLVQNDISHITEILAVYGLTDDTVFWINGHSPL